MSIAEDLFNRGKEKLAMWKARYSAIEYPRKVAINTIYELAILEAAWPTLSEKCFESEASFGTWDEAYSFIVHKFTAGVGQAIHGNVVEYLDTRDQMPNIMMAPYRDCIARAAHGSLRDLRIVENTYLLHFTAVYLVYAWAAHGMMGLGREDALQRLQVTRLSGSYADLITVYSGMNIAAQFASGDASNIEAFAYTLDLRR